MNQRVTGQQWAALLSEFRSSAWRWEAQAVYREPIEQEPLRQFLVGEEPDLSYMDSWLANVRRATSEGRSFARVRMLTDPLTDYLKFELATTSRNVAAGELIRVLPESVARRLGMPTDDFWLLDDRLAAVMHFDVSGFAYAEVVSDPLAVSRFREIRDTAWQNAVPFEEFMTTT
ncbi:DUF6879 family protein [Saccharothrix variisporea]|uniref:DUF6879 domain-containing protein n=1 Tax=Saccharothrix variisporea TaxID=543527 RepID=A0A495WZQ8_9PSEU|nr:DUF6879 family protein [Saccharothrix variisporea]RKT67127.1 hypothetical protein DFJ66_0295 [Saccharothrix variisporea]